LPKQLERTGSRDIGLLVQQNAGNARSGNIIGMFKGFKEIETPEAKRTSSGLREELPVDTSKLNLCGTTWSCYNITLCEYGDGKRMDFNTRQQILGGGFNDNF